jgi:hypothetical protein
MATHSWWPTLWAAVLVPSMVGAAAPQGPGDGRAVTRLRPRALAVFIDELGGQPVTLVNARVVAVVNPRVFLIESNVPRSPLRLDRVVVFIDAGVLRVGAETFVGATVQVAGTARTLLGLQVTREVPWPGELTPATVERLGIRAAVMATSVRTADDVELTVPA